VLLLLIGYTRATWGVSAAVDASASRKVVTPVLLYVWTGLVIGLSQYFYYGSRLIPVIAVPLVFYLLLRRRISFVQLLLLIVAALIAYAPLATHYLRNLPAFLNRTQGVSVFNPAGMAHILGPEALWPNDLPALVWKQVTRNAAFFAKSGDLSAFYFPDIAGFDPLTVALFWLGLGVLLARAYRFPEFALLIWFSLGFLLAGVVTIDSPNGPRLVVITTVVYLTGGIFLQRLLGWVQQIMPIGGKVLTVLAVGLLALATLRSNYTTYFVTYASHTPNVMSVRLAHDILALGDGYTYYIMGAPNFYADYGVLRFTNRAVVRYNAETVEDLPTPAAAAVDNEPLVVIALPHRLDELDQVIARFPGGRREERLNTDGALLYAIYVLPTSLPVGVPINEPQARTAADTTPLPASPLPTAAPATP
jgi:hypothetical protein